MISASSFWILFADVLNCFALNDLDKRSFAFLSFEADDPEAWAPPDPEPVDDEALTEAIFAFKRTSIAIALKNVASVTLRRLKRRKYIIVCNLMVSAASLTVKLRQRVTLKLSVKKPEV